MAGMISYDIVIVGGGPAGLAAAVSAKKAGTDSILIIERDKELGGILNQCIHNGFGLHTFKEELTGPEYAYRFIEQVYDLGIEYKLDTMVMDISHDKVVTAMNRTEGMFQIQAGAVILAMGCRERPRGALNIPGYRPAGIYSAGTAQRLVNMEGYMPGREVVILGSGDIGLIMARRMTFEGAIVKVVAELMPFSGGLKRNIVQCLDDYGIPLKLSHTIVDIEGKERVSAVTIAEVGPDMKPIPGTEERYTCDTLLLSTGLIPENELSRGAGVAMNPVTNGPAVNEILETSIPGVFACGNVLHVHDLVDYVSEEATRAGANAAAYVQSGCKDAKEGEDIKLVATEGARYTVPGTINVSRMEDNLTVRFRVGAVFKDSYVSVYFDDERVQHRKKRIMAPGEMEQVIIQKKKLQERPDLKTITIKIEAD
jgi:NADPH-dependent 2,4-dienoyl-CoA reductase/sulfur reductase-like enzyme